MINKSLTLITARILAIGSVTFAQSENSVENKDEAHCSCLGLLSETISRIEADYIGYHIETKGKTVDEYRRYKSQFQKLAGQTPLDKCVPLLQDFIRFFRDGHLFIGQNPKLTDEQVAQLLSKAEKFDRTESEIKEYLSNNAKKLDPIEGIWFANDGSRFAIFRNTKPKDRDFVAILLSDGVRLWAKGEVKAKFTKLDDGSYDVVYYNEKRYPLFINFYERGKRGGARIRRDVILSMAPITWGKEFPTVEDSWNNLDSSDPRRPVLEVVDSSTVLITLPSHSPSHASFLSELVERHKDKIENADNLILDLRGNEGGSAGMAAVLMPYIETASGRPSKYWVGDRRYVLSSEQNIKYFKLVERQGWLPKNLVKRLEAGLGKVIPLEDAVANEKRVIADTPRDLPKPQNVAILIDGAIVSAAEAFIINAIKSTKVTLFGQPTGGVIDYQTTSVVSYQSCADLGIYLGYPMFAASDRLPTGGVNKTGIMPDVSINPREDNPVGFIINFYKKRYRQKI
ncbi:MAG: S41 family peptidase [Pyrinomonadaceae bacterium]